MPTITDSAATTSTRALVAACRRLEMDTGALLAAAGLSPDQIADPDGRLPSGAVANLFRLALAGSAQQDLPLIAAAAVPFGAYRVIDFLAASARTIGDGLVRVARYFPLINTVAELVVHDRGDFMHVELVNASDPRGFPPAYVQYALAVTVLHCRHAAAVEWPLHEVRVAFAPRAIDAHERLFKCRVRFASDQNELVIARSVWDSESHGAASSDLLRVLEEHAENMLAELGRSGAAGSDVARLLTRELHGGDPSLENVARKLRVSPRTLQRKLRAEHSSFADLLDAARKATAECYLRDKDLSLGEVAHLLGFSEQSAFTRAFQRWYAISPARYRAERSSIAVSPRAKAASPAT